MIPLKNYQIVLEFTAPVIPAPLFWFINRAMEVELRFFGHCAGIVIGNPVAQINELYESWQTCAIPSEGFTMEIGEFASRSNNLVAQ